MLTETHGTVEDLTCLRNTTCTVELLFFTSRDMYMVYGDQAHPNNDCSPFPAVEAQPQLHSPLAAPGKVGGESRAANKGTLCAGERSAQEPPLSPVVVRGCADRGPRGEEEHCNDADGKSDAGVSKLGHPLV